jgi:tripartite-type tricarboxylate transporter receptor subunit TctC
VSQGISRDSPGRAATRKSPRRRECAANIGHLAAFPKTFHRRAKASRRAVVQALADPGLRARLADLGQEIFPPDQQTPEALRALQKAEIAKWWPIIKEAGIKAE